MLYCRQSIGVDQYGAWGVEKLYDIASEAVGGLLHFNPSGTIVEMMPDGGSSGQMSGWEDGTIDNAGGKSVGT